MAAEHKETSQDVKTAMDQDKPEETSHREDKVAAGQETCTKKQTALKQTALEKEQCKETAPEKQQSKETAPEKQQSKETAPEKQQCKETAPTQGIQKETAPEKQQSKETAPEKQQCKETAPTQGIQKETAPEKQQCKETAPTQGIQKETAPEKQQSKETAPEKQQCKETAPTQGIQKETAPEKQLCKETAPTQGIQKETAPEKQQSKETAPEKQQCKETAPTQGIQKETAPENQQCKETAAEKEPRNETAPKDRSQKDLTQKPSTVVHGKDNETALKQENIKKTASAEGKLVESGHYEVNTSDIQTHLQTAQVEKKPKETSHEKETHTEMGKTRTVQGQIKNESAGMQAPTMEQKGEHILKETGLNINRTTEDKGTLPETSHGKEAQKETYKKQGIIDHAVPTEPETAQGWMDLCITEWALKDRKISLPEGADWRVIYKKRPFGRNLLKSPNPEGLSTYQPPPQEECDPPPQRRPLETLGDFSGWTIGTEEIPVDRSNVPPGVVVCYLPVYSWCVKEQLVDLMSEGLWAELLDSYQPYIYVLDWYEDSKLHRQVYELHVRLLAADRTTVIAQYKLTPENDMCGNPGAWISVSHIFKSYGSGVRYVHFLHKSKDLSVLGFHRTHIADSTLFLQLKDMDSPNEPK